MKLKFKKPKSQLDEMQEQALLKIESKGFWIAYTGLAGFVGGQIGWDLGAQSSAIRAGQLAHFTIDFSAIMGEIIISFVLLIFYWLSCYKQGIWGRYMPASKKLNLFLSLGLGGYCSLLISLLALDTGKAIPEIIRIAILTFAGISGAFLVFSTCSLALYWKRRKKLDEE